MAPPARERYLLVASDPVAAGRQVSRVVEQTNATAVAAGGGYFVI